MVAHEVLDALGQRLLGLLCVAMERLDVDDDVGHLGVQRRPLRVQPAEDVAGGLAAGEERPVFALLASWWRTRCSMRSASAFFGFSSLRWNGSTSTTMSATSA